MGHQTVETAFGAQTYTLETGRLAKQAGGSATARLGDTLVLVTACTAKPRDDVDFFPLSVEYIEKTYAAGKIPGGFFKREGKPSSKEVLSARIIDRPIRPMFPDGYNDEVQIVATVISADEAYDADVLGVTAASMALCLSDAPFQGPVAAVRVGLINGALKVFPTLEETEAGSLDLVVAGTSTSILMVEGGACEVAEATVIEAIVLAHGEIKKLCALQMELLAKAGKDAVKTYVSPQRNEEIYAAVEQLVKERIHDISFQGDKKLRYAGLDALLKETTAALADRFPEQEKEISACFHEIERRDIRQTILSTGIRVGGRDCDTIRPISIELDISPRAHGSALFTRGETQTLGVTTLGTKLDEQRIDNIQSEYSKSYMLHYNFPPYSVGEVKRMGGTNRREIGHGHLAERSLSPVLPSEKCFPYTIRVVCEVLESNGSSSMASVCSGSLSLMAAGVPIKSHVAGVAMGLIQEGGQTAILTDILGTEDHLGDMDFKVAGTRQGITAVQMDIKVQGITAELMREAMEKARVARMKILDIMDAAIAHPRKEISRYAPRIFTVKVDKDKIREIIGPGGKIVREIQDATQTTINIEDDGTVTIYAANKRMADAAVLRIKQIAFDPEIGEEFDAVVKTITDFGAFVEYIPGREGLVHISELDVKRVARTEDVVALGDKIRVKLVGFDRNGKVRLSRKALLLKPAAPPAGQAAPQ